MADATRERQDRILANQARMIFYKYCIDNGLMSSELARFVGVGKVRTVTDGRRRFTRSFKTHPKNKEMYHRFQMWMNDNPMRAEINYAAVKRMAQLKMAS